MVSQPPRSPFAPLAVWLLPQLAVIILMAAQVPLLVAKSMPDPPELLALRTMLVLQIASSALLFPFLLRDFRATAMVILSMVPMTFLAAFLAGEVAKWKMAYAVGYVAIWLVGLALWRPILRSARAQAVGITTAMLVAFGGIVFWYLQAEYGGGTEPFDLQRVQGWSPIFGAFTAARFQRLRPAGWSLVAIVPLTAAITALIRLLLQKKRPQAIEMPQI